MAPKLFFENILWSEGYTLIAGVDEVGRGPLAGPVVAAAVILPLKNYIAFKDSKILTSRSRSRIYKKILKEAVSIGLGSVSPEEIDRVNIHRATLKAMSQAVERLSPAPDFILVDGLFPVPLGIPQKPLTKGETKSFSIAAASIVAKVVRDRMMEDLDREFPAYNFKQNRGYGTGEHQRAIRTFGISPCHRISFKGVKEYCGQETSKQLLLFREGRGEDCPFLP